MQLITTVMSIILSTGNICIMGYALMKFLNKPHDTLSERVQILEVKLKEIETSLHQGNDRFRDQENTNEVLLRSVLALIEFEIQYCLTEKKVLSPELQRAKEDLHRYLSKSKGGLYDN